MKFQKRKTSPIQIKQVLSPFSHLPGTKYPIPFSHQGVEVYPAALIVEGVVIPLKVTARVQDFTTKLDLERGVIQVFGHGDRGYFRYFLFSLEGKIAFYQDRGEPIFPAQNILIESNHLPSFKQLERISLGYSKKLEFEFVKKRQNMGELFPILFQLGQMIETKGAKLEAPSLLKEFVEARGLGLEAQFWNFFFGGFSGVFYPGKVEHLGLDLPLIDKNEDPFLCLSEGYRKIRSLIFMETSHECQVLPTILSYFLCGRATGIKTSFGTVDIEWTKGDIRQMIIHCNQSRTIKPCFPKCYKKYRLITSSGDKLNVDAKASLDLNDGNRYLLNHFEE